MAEDEKPPTGEPPPEGEKPPEPPAPPAEEKAKEEGEKVPAWGQTLIDQVQGISEALTNVVSPTLDEGGKPDDSPQPKPWHKRGLKG